MVRCHLASRLRGHLIQGLDAGDMGHVDPCLPSGARDGRDRGLLRNLRSCIGVAPQVPRFLLRELPWVLRVDDDDLRTRRRSPKNILHARHRHREIRRGLRHEDLERDRAGESPDRVPVLRRRVQCVVYRRPASDSGLFLIEYRARGHRRVGVWDVPDGGHAAPRRGTGPIRKILFVCESWIPHVDMEVHAPWEDQRLAMINRFVAPERFLDRGDPTRFVYPDAHVLELTAKEDAAANDPHAPPPRSGARWGRAAWFQRRPPPGTCRPASPGRATRPRGGPPSCTPRTRTHQRPTRTRPRPAGAGGRGTDPAPRSIHLRPG